MRPVFISYARKSSALAAQALSAELPGQCFIDASGIEEGERFPEHILDALLDSEVVVVFASDTYFQRRYCLWELRAALEPFETRPHPGHWIDGALDHLVVVVPDGEKPAELDRLPPDLQRAAWPAASDIRAIARLVRERLRRGGPTLRQRHAASGGSYIRTRLLELTALPPAALYPPAAVVFPPGLSAPSLQDDFVGRSDELHRIDFWLRTLWGQRTNAPPVVAIAGVGGLGKTRLALEYVHRFGPRHFPGGVIWINAGEELEPQFHGALRALDSRVPDLTVIRRQRRDVAAELSGALRARATAGDLLWVVDDVPEPAPSERAPPLGAYCPALGHVPVLVTSRRRLGLEPGRRDIGLRELQPDAAVQLLTRSVSSTSRLTPDGWRAIVEWVGCLPLALALLNQVLLSGYLPRTLLAASRGSRTIGMLDRAMKALRGEVEAGFLRGVAEALSISYQKLSPASRAAGILLAQLAPSPIPAPILDELGDAFPLKVRRQLVGRSFVTVDAAPASSEEIFGSMHRVLADYLQTREPTPGRAWERMCGALASALDQASQGRDQWRLLRDCSPHALHLLRRSPPDCEARDLVTASLQFAVSRSLAELGRHDGALQAAERAVEVYRRLAAAKPDTFDPKLAASLYHLSSCLGSVSRWSDALDAVAEAVSVYTRLAEVLPVPFEADLATARGWLATCLKAYSGEVKVVAATSSETTTGSATTDRDSTASASITDSVSGARTDPMPPEPAPSLPIRPPPTPRRIAHQGMLIAGIAIGALVATVLAYLPALKSGWTTGPPRREQVYSLEGATRRALRSCIEEELHGSTPFRDGTVTLVVTVDADGNAKELDMDRADIKQSALGACLRRKIQRMAFPAFTGGDINLKIPLVLGTAR